MKIHKRYPFTHNEKLMSCITFFWYTFCHRITIKDLKTFKFHWVCKKGQKRLKKKIFLNFIFFNLKPFYFDWIKFTNLAMKDDSQAPRATSTWSFSAVHKVYSGTMVHPLEISKIENLKNYAVFSQNIMYVSFPSLGLCVVNIWL